jgi:hypothetical protein
MCAVVFILSLTKSVPLKLSNQLTIYITFYDYSYGWGDTMSFGQMLIGQTSFGQKLIGQTSFGQKLIGQTSFGQKSNGPIPSPNLAPVP